MTLAKRYIRFSVIDIVNKTNTSIISKIFSHSSYGFTHYTKDRILQNYDYTCNIYNCYVCSVIQPTCLNNGALYNLSSNL